MSDLVGNLKTGFLASRLIYFEHIISFHFSVFALRIMFKSTVFLDMLGCSHHGHSFLVVFFLLFFVVVFFFFFGGGGGGSICENSVDSCSLSYSLGS